MKALSHLPDVKRSTSLKGAIPMSLKQQLAGALGAGILVLSGPVSALAHEMTLVPVV